MIVATTFSTVDKAMATMTVVVLMRIVLVVAIVSRSLLVVPTAPIIAPRIVEIAITVIVAAISVVLTPVIFMILILLLGRCTGVSVEIGSMVLIILSIMSLIAVLIGIVAIIIKDLPVLESKIEPVAMVSKLIRAIGGKEVAAPSLCHRKHHCRSE